MDDSGSIKARQAVAACERKDPRFTTDGTSATDDDEDDVEDDIDDRWDDLRIAGNDL